MASKKLEIDPKFWHFVIFVFFGMIAIWSLLTQNTTYGATYTIVFLFTLILIIASVVLHPVVEWMPSSPDQLILQVLAGFGLGIVLISSILFSFSFLSPLSIPNVSGMLGVLGLGGISLAFIMSIGVSEFEEGLRAATLRPTIAEWLSYSKGVSMVLLLVGFMMYFIIDMDIFKLFGIVLMFLSVLNYFYKGGVADRIQTPWVRQLISGLIAASFFALLHFTAYGSADPAVTASLMMNAFLYAFIADTINAYFKNTVSSRIAHTLNNAAVSCIAVGLPIPFAFVIAGAHAGLLYMASTE